MSTTPDTVARTRAYARVIGPFLVMVPAIVAFRAGEAGALISAFFGNPALAWIAGGLLLFAGLVIIARHQIWSSGPAILISLIGWLLALRGLALLIAPQFLERAAASVGGTVALVRAGAGVLVLVGLWLSWVGWAAKPPRPGA